MLVVNVRLKLAIRVYVSGFYCVDLIGILKHNLFNNRVDP